MKLAFMSSVCPRMSLAELITVGKAHGYQGIEFRPEWGQGHGIELAATTAERAAARRQLQESGLEPCCLSPGVKFCHEEVARREAELAKLAEYIELAHAVGIGRIRVFGDPLPDGGGGRRAANYQVQAECLARAAQQAAAAGVKLVLETHMNFRACDAGEVLFRAAYPPALGINWHLAHCLNHGEDIYEAYRHVKGRVAHVHFALDEKESEGPSLVRQRHLLRAEAFADYFSVEVINPPDPLPVLVRHSAAWSRWQSSAV